MLELMLAALLLITDPTGDAVGNGTLQAPTAAIYRSTSTFDVTEFAVLDAPTLQFGIKFGSLANPLGLPNGFSFPIIEIYVNDLSQGSTSLLPGSNMSLPGNASWRYALRITGDDVHVYQADGETILDISEDVNVTIRTEDSTIFVSTNLSRPDEYRLYSIVGQYDPFQGGWRPLSTEASPWSFSSPEQQFPVIDVVAETRVAQQEALNRGVLPEIKSPPKPNWWLLVILVGCIIAFTGVIARFFWVKQPSSTPPQDADADAHDDIWVDDPVLQVEQARDAKHETGPQTPSVFNDDDGTFIPRAERMANKSAQTPLINATVLPGGKLIEETPDTTADIEELLITDEVSQDTPATTKHPAAPESPGEQTTNSDASTTPELMTDLKPQANNGPVTTPTKQPETTINPTPPNAAELALLDSSLWLDDDEDEWQVEKIFSEESADSTPDKSKDS